MTSLLDPATLRRTDLDDLSGLAGNPSENAFPERFSTRIVSDLVGRTDDVLFHERVRVAPTELPPAATSTSWVQTRLARSRWALPGWIVALLTPTAGRTARLRGSSVPGSWQAPPRVPVPPTPHGPGSEIGRHRPGELTQLTVRQLWYLRSFNPAGDETTPAPEHLPADASEPMLSELSIGHVSARLASEAPGSQMSTPSQVPTPSQVSTPQDVRSDPTAEQGLPRCAPRPSTRWGRDSTGDWPAALLTPQRCGRLVCRSTTPGAWLQPSLA